MTDKLTVVSESTDGVLNPREHEDYYEHKESFIEWLTTRGKDPDTRTGYASTTTQQTGYKVDRFFQWLWEERGHYTTSVSADRLDDYMEKISNDYADSALSTTQKSLKRYVRFRDTTTGTTIDWEPEMSFSDTSMSAPRDFLTVEEREIIRDAALEYGSVPHYDSMLPDERDRWKIFLAQRFEKPKSAIGPEDFERANSWKFPSLVWTSLDTGLRPIEVGRAQTYWVDTQNKVLRIPKEESSKNTQNWTVSITDRTAEAVDRWLAERAARSKYDETDALWLTQYGNPYNSGSLRQLLHRLCDIGELPIEGRMRSWYAIRHSVGTYMTREEDLKAAQSQLRHTSPETTMRYDQAPIEDRRDALNRMG